MAETGVRHAMSSSGPLRIAAAEPQRAARVPAKKHHPPIPTHLPVHNIIYPSLLPRAPTGLSPHLRAGGGVRVGAAPAHPHPRWVGAGMVRQSGRSCWSRASISSGREGDPVGVAPLLLHPVWVAADGSCGGVGWVGSAEQRLHPRRQLCHRRRLPFLQLTHPFQLSREGRALLPPLPKDCP